MNFIIWVYQNNSTNEFYKWRAEMPARQVGKMEDRITKLSQIGEELFPLTLASTAQSGILKIKVQGNPKLRPLLCRGPFEALKEYTLLIGATEVGFRYKPEGALNKALANKLAVKGNSSLRVEYVAS